MTIGKLVIDAMIFAIMRIDVLALDGVFDTGLTALLDVFGTANELSGGKQPLRLRTVGVRRRVRTSVDGHHTHAAPHARLFSPSALRILSDRCDSICRREE